MHDLEQGQLYNCSASYVSNADERNDVYIQSAGTSVWELQRLSLQFTGYTRPGYTGEPMRCSCHENYLTRAQECGNQTDTYTGEFA